ncbi:glycosyltransferase family 2 protein [Providencia vermicola]|uniref:glycosyltransferase family 2 protein n=1 Tax=Providencia TaxID=586 RepID=UPI00197F5272|nr:glycosyltransferase [Providencia stuartii]MBN5559076.1 glycosyltransferase [Providencia stuartii]HEM8266253.1 glycosyltransferase [Providencia stuartii]HEM8286224.1 glycosyltransferase [Providencia stuartii]
MVKLKMSMLPLKKTFSAVKISNQLLLKMNINPLKAPENEASIMKHWKYTDKVYVSCVCITFNQEGYIRDAINGMLAQVTDYKFEVIIHDDVSNDNTRKILLEYKNKYPNIIKLVLQTENQYQKGKKITPLAVAEAIGEYIALCEGDDYWIDINKIQKQVKCLEENKDINICFTSAQKLTHKNNLEEYAKHNVAKTIYSTSNVIRGGGEFMPTASIMVKKTIINTLPEWYHIAPVGDYFLQIYSSLPNGALYLPQCTACYRINSIGSWTAQRKKINLNKIENEASLYKAIFNTLSNLNIDSSDIKYAISKQLYILSIVLIKNKEYSHARKLIIESWDYYKGINSKHTILFYMRNLLPLFRLLLKLLNKK